MANFKRALIPFAFGLVTAFAGTANPANAEVRWQVTKMDSSSEAAALLKDARPLADAGLPNGRVATFEDGDISSAWYGSPTRRYAHGILGDDIEAGTLHVKTKNGRTHKINLSKFEVFEDLTPRLADLDGDGSIEVITIRSSLLAGASMTIYGMDGIRLKEKASTGFIGKPNRWLNIAGIAPFLGSKYQEVGLVVTPHIGGTLIFYRYDGKKLIKLSGARDVSNHVIGSSEMRLSAVADVDSDGSSDLAVPSDDRETLKIFGFKNNKLNLAATAALPAPIDKAIGLQTEGTKGFIVGLENSAYYLVHP